MFKNYELFNGLVSLIPKVLTRIEPAFKEKYFPTDIKNYPNLKYNESGFPSISHYPSKSDVGNLFRDGWGGRNPTIFLKEYDEFNQLLQITLACHEFVQYYKLEMKSEETTQMMLQNSCEAFIESFIERYYYIYGAEFDVEKFVKIYQPVENFIYAEKLHFDISVPILFVQFETDKQELAPGIFIRKIDDQVQRSRHSITGYSPVVVDSVFMSATHELVFENYFFDKPPNWLQSSFSQPGFYRELPTEKFITFLKIVSDATSGYAQFLIHPKDWVESYSSDLIPLTGAATKNYPAYFDDYYWNSKDFPKISAIQIQEIGELFRFSVQSKENKLEFALKRFYKSIMREAEEDVIIDLIIALEMLLGDPEKSEITHKLSLRLAALLSHCGNGYDPIQVFKLMKRIYGFRSSVVHGSHDISKKREIKLEENVTVPLVNLAKNYLREVLKIIIKNPQYIKVPEIDRLLLVRK